MANVFFDPGSQRAAKVNALFDRIADRYDRINDWQSLGMHRRWKRQVLAQADLRAGQRALDVCCGTGDLAIAMAARGVSAIGLDFSAPMLAVAQRRAREARIDTVQFVRADALRLPFAEGSFDVVTIGYGLRNLAEVTGGLRELLRVLKVGGRLLILDFGKPENPVWRTVYFAYLNLMVPCFGRLFCGNAEAYAYILESLRHYPAQTGVMQLLEQLGGRNLRLLNFLGGAMSLHCADKG